MPFSYSIWHEVVKEHPWYFPTVFWEADNERVRSTRHDDLSPNAKNCRHFLWVNYRVNHMLQISTECSWKDPSKERHLPTSYLYHNCRLLLTPLFVIFPMAVSFLGVLSRNSRRHVCKCKGIIHHLFIFPEELIEENDALRSGMNGYISLCHWPLIFLIRQRLYLCSLGFFHYYSFINIIIVIIIIVIIINYYLSYFFNPWLLRKTHMKKYGQHADYIDYQRFNSSNKHKRLELLKAPLVKILS